MTRDDLLDVVGVGRSERPLLDAHPDRQRATVLERHDVAGSQVLHALVDWIQVEHAERRAATRAADGHPIELARIERRRSLRVPVDAILLTARVQGQRRRSKHQLRRIAARNGTRPRVARQSAHFHDRREVGVERGGVEVGASTRIGDEWREEEEVGIPAVRPVDDQRRRTDACRRLERLLVTTCNGEDGSGDGECQALHAAAPVDDDGEGTG